MELHIDELILHGFPPGDRYHIAEAVRSALARLFVEQGTPGLPQSFSAGQLDSGAFDVTPGSKSEGVGTQVAQVIYRSVHR